MSERVKHWQRLLDAWEKSGLSQAAFWRRRRISVGLFAWWKRRRDQMAGRRVCRVDHNAGGPAVRGGGEIMLMLSATVRMFFCLSPAAIFGKI